MQAPSSTPQQQPPSSSVPPPSATQGPPDASAAPPHRASAAGPEQLPSGPAREEPAARKMDVDEDYDDLPEDEEKRPANLPPSDVAGRPSRIVSPVRVNGATKVEPAA